MFNVWMGNICSFFNYTLETEKIFFTPERISKKRSKLIFDFKKKNFLKKCQQEELCQAVLFV